MEQFFRVAIHYDNDLGYIEYGETSRKIKVVLNNSAKKTEVENFLGKRQVIRVTQNGLRDFVESTVQPAESLAALKYVLTNLWKNTEVYVDWSRPVEI